MLLEEIKLEKRVINYVGVFVRRNEFKKNRIGNNITSTFGVGARPGLKCRGKWSLLKSAVLKKTQ